MDLQAILDESDTSSVLSGSPIGDGSSSGDELERILREDEISVEDVKNTTGESLSTIETAAHHYHLLTSQKQKPSDLSGIYDVDEMSHGAILNENTVRTIEELGYSASGSQHNAEDWAVLQQILGEDDEADGTDGADEWNDGNKSSKLPSFLRDSKFTTSKNKDVVDDILNSIHSDDEGDTPAPLSTHLTQNSKPDDLFLRVPDAVSPMWLQEEEGEPQLSAAETVDSISRTHRDEPMTIESSEQETRLSDTEHESLTEAALKQAEAYERRILRSGHRDIVSPLHVKRRMKPRFLVGTRNQKASKDKIATNQNKAQPHFEFSGLMESITMPKLSSYLLRPEMKHGLPTALAVNSKFIAIGFQKGIVCVFDLFEVLRQQLGLLIEQPGSSESSIGNVGSVSSIDITTNGEALIAGYTSGKVVLWDVIKGTILRSITDSHPSPITMVRFLTDRDMKAVSVDAGGLVLKLSFAKNLLWSNYSMDTECLLDGAAGQILAMDVLPPLSSIDPNVAMAPKLAQLSFLHDLVLIALSSERSSFAVAVEPSISVLHRWARPPSERIRPGLGEAEQVTMIDLPCLSWGWALISGGGHVATPILARAWGCCVQLLQGNFPHTASMSTNEEEEHFWPAFGVHDEFDVTAPVVSLEWLGERSLVYLTAANELTVVDTVMMTLVERLDFSGLRLVYAEFSLSRSAKKKEADAPLNICTTFQNSVRFSDNRILVLCQEEVKSVSILGAKRRILTLEQDGEWLEALALALDHYENTIKSQEDRKRDPDGIKDLSKHPEFSTAIRSEDEEWIAKLLLRYLSLAIENAPESDASMTGDELHSQTRTLDLAQSHFQMLAGVCIEFCVVTRRLDLLFGEIFRRFFAVGFTSVFLDVLEPYVLNDKLDYIAPETMAHFIEHCRATNGVATVERCLLHMDVTIMDFDNILNLLRRNEMYSALIHVYTHGLNDFVTPLEILLERIFDSADEGNVTGKRRKNGLPQNSFDRFGYKAILYVRNCLRGKTFPQEENLKPEGRIQTLRPQLLHFFLQEKYTPSFNARDRSSQMAVFGHRSFSFPYTHVLLMVDPKALLDTLSLALDSPEAKFEDPEIVFESMGGWEVEVGAETTELQNHLGDSGERGETNGTDANRCPSIQRIINMLSSILLPDDGRESPSNFASSVQSKFAVDVYLDFMAKYLMKGVVRANKNITFLILSRMTSRFAGSNLASVRVRSQEQVIELVTALPRNSYDPDDILALVDTAGINRAALILHQEGVSSWHHGDNDGERRAEHLRRAIDCYLSDDEPEFRKGVFAYVKKECTGGSCLSDSPDEDDVCITRSSTLRGALSEKLADLVNLDPLLSTQLVAELFIEELDEIVGSLGSRDNGVAQFLFLDAVISGELTKADTVAGPVLAANLTMDHHHKYLALMAKLHPDKVYQYLSTHDNYRPDECLRLCQEYDIADASAYLLERMGNVSSALQLVLQTLEARLMGLKRVVRGTSTDSFENSLIRKLNRDWNKELDTNASAQKGKETDGVRSILIVALDLCERNSGTASARSEQSSQLWFNVLDRLINAKGFLRLSKEKPEHAKMMAVVLSHLLQLTMQRMVSSVPLPDLVRKVTAEHSGSKLGEFREMVGSMLSTYGFELDVCMGAVNVMHHDVQFMEREHRRLKLEGSRVQRVVGRRIGVSGSFGDVVNSDTTMVLRDDGDVVFKDASLTLASKQKTGGLENVVYRLRSRRGGDNDGDRPWNRAKVSLNMMTLRDQLFHAGESSEAAFLGERHVGVLGVAEHYGTFG